ncbi:MAG: LysE family translocator [Pseudomonadota bacterium]
MPPVEYLIGFIGASLVLLLLPGPGVFYVVARSVSQGPRAGLVSVVGLTAGAFVHVVFATVGLSAVLLASATIFGFIKLLGAAYLIYLGLQALFDSSRETAVEKLDAEAGRKIFMDGVIVSVLNPKIAVFFLAFLPQFVDPSGGNASQQILLLGVIYCCLALITDGCYAILASRARRWLGGPLGQSALPRYGSGAVYIGLGVGTAFTEVD